MYRHFSNNGLSHFKMLLELIHGSAVEAAVDIGIRIEGDMDVCMAEPVLQNDRLHSGLYTPCRKGVAKRVLPVEFNTRLFTDPSVEAVHL